MDIRKLIIDTLTDLFDTYKTSHGTGLYHLEGVARVNNIQSHELVEYLKQEGWIKSVQYGEDGFYAQITHEGIERIAPDYFDGLVNDFLSIAGIQDDWIGLVETLAQQPEDFQLMFDLGKELESRNLAEVQYQAQEIFAKLNFRGKAEYQSNFGDSPFLNL